MKSFAIALAIIIAMNPFFPKNASCITIAEEEELSREFMKVVLKHFKVIKDPVIVNYVNGMGQKIVSVFPPQPFTYHFYVIEDHAYNAFAAPAGHIFINSGLLEAMDDEEELAGILSHEIAHAFCRHISQKIERSSKIGLATLAGIAAGIFLGVGGAGAAAEALTVGTMAAGQSVSLAYSRENERQADQVGLKYLNKAGYTGAGLLAILKKIRNKQWYGSDVIPAYLTTHPAVEERISYLERGEGARGRGARGEGADEFERVHSRLVAVYGDVDVALKKFEADIATHPDDPIAHHGYGVVLARTNNRKDAVIHFKKALEQRVLDACLLKDLGITYFSDGQYQNALSTLTGAISIDPSDPDAHVFLGRTQMELNAFEEAADTFEALLEKHPDHKQVRYFLGQAYGKQDKLGDAHYHLGLYYKDRGDLRNAMFHLKRALKHIKAPDKKLEIENMLEEIRKRREAERVRD